MQDAGKPSIQSLLLEEIAAHLAAQNQRPYRAKQIADWIYQKRVTSFEEMTRSAAGLREQLAEEFAFDEPRNSPCARFERYDAKISVPA